MEKTLKIAHEEAMVLIYHLAGEVQKHRLLHELEINKIKELKEVSKTICLEKKVENIGKPKFKIIKGI